MVVFKRRSGIMIKLIAFVLPIPVLCFFVGLVIGMAQSPDYSTADSARQYVSNHFQPVFEDADDIVVEVKAGTRVYRYSLKSGDLAHRSMGGIELANLPIERHWKMFDYKYVSGVLGFSTLTSSVVGIKGVVESGGTWRKAEAVLVTSVAVVALAGGYLGYHLAYSDNPDFDSDAFKKGFKDKNTWQQVAEDVRKCKADRDLADSPKCRDYLNRIPR